MKLIIKNKLISIGGASSVKDENGKDLFKIKGKVFTTTKKKKIYDMEGNKLFTVRSKYWHLYLRSAYIFDGEGNKIAQLKNKFNRQTQYISEGFEHTYRIGKNSEGRGRAIYKDEALIGVWSNKKLHLVDTFEVEYENADDAGIIVALMIAIDNINDDYIDDL